MLKITLGVIFALLAGLMIALIYSETRPQEIRFYEPRKTMSEGNTGIARIPDKKSLIFVLDSKKVGEFWFEDETRTFQFEGDPVESIRLFSRIILENQRMTEIEAFNNLAEMWIDAPTVDHEEHASERARQ